MVDDSFEKIDSGEDFTKMLNESFADRDSSKVVSGKIVKIDRGSDGGRVLVDVGDKMEGILNIKEILNKDDELLFKEGDDINVVITGYFSERPKVSYRKFLDEEYIKDFINKYKDSYEDVVLDVVVKSKNRGGYVVSYDSVSDSGDNYSVGLFLPKSLSAFKDDVRVVDRNIKVKIIKIDQGSNSVVVSRKKLLNEEAKTKRELVKTLLEEDKVINGTVKKITSYGMFVDVGGIDGLVSYNEISYKGPVNPSKYYKEGDRVEVKCMSYDKTKKHLSLSVKAVYSDPWKEIEDELDVGDTIKVTVSNIESYGVFVDLGNDVEGFLHVSEISWAKNVKHPKDYLKIGDEMNVEVIEIDKSKRKLRVSKKKLEPKPFDKFLGKYKEGNVVSGIVTTVTDFGAFIKIDEVECLLHNQDINWEKNSKCKDILKKGDEIEVKILRISKDDEKVSLSRKALLTSPIELFSKSNKIGDIVKGVVRDIKDFGVFVSLSDNVDALIKMDDLYPLNAGEIKKDDEIEAVLILIEPSKDRIRLSVRKLEKRKEQDVLKKINDKDDDAVNSLGDIIKDKL